MNKINNILANIGGGVRLAAFLSMIAALVPAAVIYKIIHPNDPFTFSRLFHRTTLLIFGIRVRTIGSPSKKRPVLFAANHASYLDITILGSLLKASFVAKSDVAEWPLFGFLSKLQETVFVERRASRAAAQIEQLRKPLKNKRNIILFPEGTSSSGLSVLRFKSSLFSVIESAGETRLATVQPISVTCVELNGKPISRENRDLYAWYADMTLVPHLWNALKWGRFTVEVRFHSPLALEGTVDRKELASLCQQATEQGVAKSLATPSLKHTA